MNKSIHTLLYKRIVARLRSKREETGFTQKMLADMLEKPQAYISKIETCERRMDIVELRTICKMLGLSFVDFIDEVEKEIVPEVEKIELKKYSSFNGRSI